MPRQIVSLSLEDARASLPQVSARRSRYKSPITWPSSTPVACGACAHGWRVARWRRYRDRQSLDSEGVRHSDRRSRTVDSERAARDSERAARDSERAARLWPQHDEPVQSRDFRRRHADSRRRHGDRSCGGQRRKRGTGHSCCTRCSGRNAVIPSMRAIRDLVLAAPGMYQGSNQQFEIQSHPIRPLLNPTQARQCRRATGRA